MAVRARTLLAVGGVLVATVVASGCADASDDDTPERRAFAFSGKTLTIDSGNSDIDLVPAREGAEDIKVTRWFSGWTAVGGDVERTWSMKGDTLSLDTDCDGLVQNCESRHRVEVPRGVALTVEDDNGTVTATGFDTALKLSSDNGAVRVREARGRLELDSDNGEISATGVSSRQVSAQSDNGKVELGFVRVPDRVETESDNGEIGIELPRASYDVTAETENGETEVRVPRDERSEHRVSARSSNGKVEIRTAN